MKERKYTKDILFTLLGIALMAGGLIVKKMTGETRFTSCFLAAGIFLFGRSTANLLKDYAVSTPELKKQQEIEENDERNMQIREKAAGKSLAIMQGVLLVVGLALTFADNTLVGIIVICLSILQSFLFAYFTSYYQKRM